MTTNAMVPKWANDDQIQNMKDRASGFVTEIKDKSGPALSRALDVLGKESNAKMTAANDLMQGSVKSLLTDLDGESKTAELVLDLRSTFDAQNPSSVTNSFGFKFLPEGMKRKMVKNFITKYQSLQSHVDQTFIGLAAGKDELLEDNLDLEQQYEEVMVAKKSIEEDIHIGNLLLERIEELKVDAASDPEETQKLAIVENKVVRRIRDLATKRQAAVQFFVSIDHTMQNNELLNEQIDSALTVGPMVMTNALRIQAALQKQKTVANAVQSLQEGLGTIMEQNAAAIDQNADDIGKMYNNPVLALESMQKSHDQLMSAVNKTQLAMAESTAKAKEATAILQDMTTDLEPIAIGMHESRTGGGDVLPEMSEKLKIEGGKPNA